MLVSSSRIFGEYIRVHFILLTSCINIFSVLPKKKLTDRMPEKTAMDRFGELNFVQSKIHYCTPSASSLEHCRPAADGVSSLDHLLKKPLRVAVWAVAAVTCLGNVLVLWGRFTTVKTDNRIVGIVIRNLAVSDLLMGLYLLAIGAEDIHCRDIYQHVANQWINSWSCTFLGILAMISSEVSVMILTFMSVERFLAISAPLKVQARFLTQKNTTVAMIVIWILGIVLAVFPVALWSSTTRFYGLNGMCFPLYIDEPFLDGWEYSAFVVLVVNLLGLVINSCVYVGMFVNIWRTRHCSSLCTGESDLALRFFLIVLTDAVCWLPIICLKILALLDFSISPDLHAWVVVFILPVNSAINPLLYTFTTPNFIRRLYDGWSSVAGKRQRKDSHDGKLRVGIW